MANVATNLETGATLGDETATSKEFKVVNDVQGNKIMLAGIGGTGISITTGASATFKISTINNACALLIVQNSGSGISAVLHVGFTNYAVVISQTGTEFIVTGSPTTSQTKVTFANTGSTVTIQNGSTSTRDYSVMAFSTGL